MVWNNVSNADVPAESRTRCPDLAETSRGDSPVGLPPPPECCKPLCLGLLSNCQCDDPLRYRRAARYFHWTETCQPTAR